MALILGEWIKRFCVMFVIIMLSGAWGSSVKEDLLKKDIEQSSLIQIDHKFYQVTEVKP